MFKLLIKISRPRFWFYLAGPLLIGAAAITSFSWQNYWFYLLLIYFLLPANLYLYGINDYFDYDTDKYNQKKEDKELRLDDLKLQRFIAYFIFIFLFFSALLIFFIPGNLVKLLLVLFIFLATFYSSPPLRFKRYPLVDSLSNILYIIPGFIAYALITGDLVAWPIVIATWAWASAMHLFSAILDIKADKQAKLKTSAILFGSNWSLIVCFLLWLVFSLIIVLNNYLYPLSLLFFIYPLIPLSLLIFKVSAHRVYWYFPFLTSLLGFLSFWYLIIF
jgi:lycopene elongase/hydratase (dihydrobisanhydrobacterioruberin-forming)